MTQAIVTIQLGNYSNFIGSHFWNLHENSFTNDLSVDSIDADVHYSEGETAGGVTTFTPRLICVDWKENLGAKAVGDLYEEFDGHQSSIKRLAGSDSFQSLIGNVAVCTGLTDKELKATTEHRIIPQTEYHYWNEYLYSRYHPKSLFSLPKLYRGFNKDNFRGYSQGIELAGMREFRDNMEEQTRYFVEKCDSLQGFQVLCDRNSGFSGVASSWLDHLNDEYSQSVISILVSDSKDDTSECLFNNISSLTALNSSSTVTTPMSIFTPENDPRDISNVRYNAYSKYHTGAIIALAIKSLTHSCVLKQKLYSICDFSSVVSEKTNNIVSIALSVPLPIQDSLCDSLISNKPDKLFSTLNPFSSTLSTLHSAIGSIHGVPSSRILTTEQQMKSSFRHCSNASEIMKTYIDDHFHSQQTCFFNMSQSMSLAEPFPKIFTPNIDPFNGHVSKYMHDDEPLLCPQQMPLSTMMYTDNNPDTFIPLYNAAKDALRRNKWADILSSTERDSLTEVLENFRNII